MLLTRPERLVCDAPNTRPALNPPMDNRYCRPWKFNVPLPPEPPINQPPFNTEMRMLPLSAWAVDATLAPMMVKKATSPARIPDIRVMHQVLFIVGITPDSPYHRPIGRKR